MDKAKKYPLRCVSCREKSVFGVVVNHNLEKSYDGRLYALSIEKLPVNRCASCGRLYFTNESDEAIAAALRARIGLLSPEQIKSNIESLRITQKRFAECLGIAAESLSRWLNGTVIQSRAMDNLMRSYFGSSKVRENLCGEDAEKTFGAVVDRSGADLGERITRRFMDVITRNLSKEIAEQNKNDILVFSSALRCIFARPLVARSFSLWSQALVKSFYGRDALSSQWYLFPESSPLRRDVQESELKFVSIAEDFASIPDELRCKSLESIRATLSFQKEAITAIRPQLAEAFEAADKDKESVEC